MRQAQLCPGPAAATSASRRVAAKRGCLLTGLCAQYNVFRPCELHGPCIALACGDHNTAVLTSAGRVLVAGDNTYGQCGHHHADAPQCPTFQVGI